ncbi:MAG: hypothetical protein KDA41_03985, partial [Planctomycetales bacterium]|nr:hypothetical protein [Planctomycetales bacterium]
MDSTPANNANENAPQRLSDAVRAERERSRRFLGAWSESRRDLQRRLTETLEASARRLAQAADDNAAAEADLETRLATLAEKERHAQQLQQDVARLQAGFAEREASLLGLQEEMHAGRQAMLDEFARHGRLWESQQAEQAEREQRLRSATAELDQRAEALAAEQAAFERRRAELESDAAKADDELERELEHFQEELARLQKQSQERHETAQQLRDELDRAGDRLARREAENAELLSQLEKVAALDHESASASATLESQLAELREKAESQQAASQAALARARGDNERLREELESLRVEADALRDEATRLQADNASLEDKLGDKVDAAALERIGQLEQERDALL